MDTKSARLHTHTFLWVNKRRTNKHTKNKWKKKNATENWINCNGNSVCKYRTKKSTVKGIEFLGLPPVTRHVNTMSSPSSIGPSIVPFNWWPHRFNTNGYSGGTKRFQQQQHQQKRRWTRTATATATVTHKGEKCIRKKYAENDTKEEKKRIIHFY